MYRCKVWVFALSWEKQMCGKISLLVLLALLFFALSVRAQQSIAGGSQQLAANPGATGSIPAAGLSLESDGLLSPSVRGRFYEIAYNLAGSKDAERPEIEQAIALLAAAVNLDSDGRQARGLLIELACRQAGRDHFSLVYSLLVDYVDQSADLDVAERAITYLLERMNSREEREKLLAQLLNTIGPNNIILSSKLDTMLGLLKTEKADLKAAEFHFIQAYTNNRYNKLAFTKLAELAPEQIGPAVRLERLRLALRENPSDIEAAIAFANFAEHLQLYQTAAAGYEYCANLFRYLYESEPIPARIYLPWAISSYNTKRSTSKCLRIAKLIRQERGFDLRLEAIAGKAAIKIGDVELATQIFQEAEEKAKQMLAAPATSRSISDSGSSESSRSRQAYLEQLAWFYCFALPIPGKAIPLANEAWAAENSPVTAALLAYALVTDKQIEWAKPLLKNQERNQIADLALGQIQLADGQVNLAIETLRSAIARDPGSFAAEHAKEILVRQGKAYVPPTDPNAVLASLQNAFDKTFVPVFIAPEQIISAQLDVQGETFPYGDEFSGIVAVVNNSSEPFVIGDDGLFKGNIRVDAAISGDLSKNIPDLVFTKVRTTFLAEPGRSVIFPVRLFTGELRRILLSYPQASLDIEFTLYLDPVMTDDGRIANRLTHVQPTGARVRRPGFKLTGKDLMDRFNSISRAPVEQKIKTAQLFTGLMTEQHEMSKRKLPYRVMYADWAADLMRSALLHESGLLRNPAENEWVVKVHTMAEMLSLPLDHELISAVAENLNDAKWPVRMMAIYLLANRADGRFDKVLDWAAKNDRSKSVRDLAIALSGRSRSE
jgi:hypothetical protein